MTMYNREYAREVVALVKDHEMSFRTAMEAQRRLSPPVNDQSVPTDEQFAAWFEMKTAENPNWPLALPYVQGGLELLERYEAIVGLSDGRMANNPTGMGTTLP